MAFDELFCVNEVLMDLSADSRYRLLWISPDGEECWWITLDGSKRVPERVTVRDLDAWKKSGRLVRTEDPSGTAPILSRKQKERRDKRYAIIEGAVIQEPEIYRPDTRGTILEGVSKKTGVKVQNLYVYLGKYWKGGKTADALADPAGKRGKCRDYTKGSYKPLGRKKREGSPGKVLGPEDFRYFSQALQKYYFTQDKLTLQETYDQMLKDGYCTFEDHGDGVREAHMKPSDELPSFMQFRYWYRKNRDTVGQMKAREGEGGYQREGRAVTGYTERKYNYPGAAFQIDATIADVYLVKENDRSAPIGRPVMYFVMDAYTRMVTGMHITFRYPSWTDAILALDNTMGDKTEYCRRFGISIANEEWPCMQLPSALIADRGEMEGRAADVLVSGLGIRIENTPPYRGDLKGVIEQHFRVINLEMSDLLPGKVKKDFGERGSRDYRLDAKLDIRQFTRIIIKCVLFYNNSHFMEDYRKEPQMRSMGVLPVPRELWNFGLRYRSGGLQTLPREKVRYALFPKEDASVTERGIAFHDMFYTCPEAVRENWFSLARMNGRRKVTVAYDPSSTAFVYLMLEDGRHIRCTRADLEGSAADTTFDEADSDHQADLDQKASHSHEELERKAELDDFIEQEIKAAKGMAPKDPGIPKTRRIADIGKNRREAIAGEAGGEGTSTGQKAEPGQEEKNSGNDRELNAVEKMIRRQLEERLKRMEEQE